MMNDEQSMTNDEQSMINDELYYKTHQVINLKVKYTK